MSNIFDKTIENVVPMCYGVTMMKTSFPDWLADQYVCDCDTHMCPMCDVDFYVDMARDDESMFIPADDTPPF